MATVPESTNQGTPHDGNPSPFPPFGNISAPYMVMLSLPRFTIGLAVWLFSTFLAPNVLISLQLGSLPRKSSPPSEEDQPRVDTHIDPFSSSLVWSSSSSSSSSGESLKVGNQVNKKSEEKRKIKKKKNKERVNQASIATDATDVQNLSNKALK